MRLISRSRRFVSRHEPVLGTMLHLRIDARRSQDAERAQQVLLTEIDRLSRIFSVFDATSELNMWRSGPDDSHAGRELTSLLVLASHWQAVADGMFNPAVGFLTERWRAAERAGVPPTADELASLADAVRSPRYRIVDGHVQKTADCRLLNFNALAKGLVVDLATTTVLTAGGIDAIVVNVGGDLVHRGRGELVVGIEDPKRAYDNAPPLMSVAIADQGLATSGSARRGFRIAGRWYSHVIDPRTGWPVDRVASASVVARDAATADAVATLLSVLDPAEGVALVDSGRIPFELGGEVACCIVDDAGAVVTNARWDAQARSPVRPSSSP